MCYIFWFLDTWKGLVQFSHSVVSDSATPWIAACQASLSITNSQSSLKLMSIELVMSSSHLILCTQSLPASGSFPMSQLFPWGGQSIGVSASASVLPMNTQDWSPLGGTGWVVVVVKVTHSCPALATPWTVARQVSLSMGFPQARILEGIAISYSRSW